MFFQIFWFDFKYNLKRPITWIFISVAFIFPAVYMALEGGLIGNVIEDINSYCNSALKIAAILNAGINNSFIGTMVLITLMAPAIQKDFQYHSQSIYFTKPISKFGYVMGRFISAFSIALVVLMSSIISFVLICNLPIYPEGRVGSYGLWNYLQGFVFLTIPNTFFVGSLFFSIVTYTRNMLSGYIGSLVLTIFVNTAGNLLKDIDNSLIPSLIDPYGYTALYEMTQYWTAQETNQLDIPFTGYLLYNRIVWIVISSLLFLITYLRFNFQQEASAFSFFRKKKAASIGKNVFLQNRHSPKVTSFFDMSLSVKTWASLTKIEYKYLVKSWYFIITVLIIIASTFFNYDVGTSTYGTRTLPVSYNMVDIIFKVSFGIGTLIILFYSGALVWRERDSKTDGIISATPIKTWVLLVSKISSLTWMYATLIFVCILFCIFIQIGNDFTDIQPMVYLKGLFGYHLIGIFIIICLTVSVQVLVNNRYLGYFVCILIIRIIPLALSKYYKHNGLILFNSSGPFLPYSDMNGFGPRFFPFAIYKCYWLSFICLLLVTANLMWSRGNEHTFKSRLIFAKNSFTKIHLGGYIFGFICMIFFGNLIYYNTRVLNKFPSLHQLDDQRSTFEKKYKKYARLPKLKIVDIKFYLAIYPKTRSIMSNGAYWIKNKGRKNVDSLFLTYDPDFNGYKVQILNNSFTELLNDSIYGVKLFKLGKPVIAGDSLQIKFSYHSAPKGFKELDDPMDIVENGNLLFSNHLFPGISYDENNELDDNLKRSEFGLKSKERIHSIEDTASLQVNYISPDADWIRFECTLSTSVDQTAIAPGFLVKKWTENNRNYFHFKMDKPILGLLSFQSGRYQIKTSKWKDVNVEIYYDKKHPYNIEAMMTDVKKSLDYYSKNFSDYQFKQLRIVEFPRYQLGTQGLAGTVMFSEASGFIAAPDFTKEDAIDYTFINTAYSVAQQWWGQQVTGGNVKGSLMISKTLAGYSALKVMEKEFGEKAMRKFLKYEVDEYLEGRVKDVSPEDPLLYSEGQSYIDRDKGPGILYAISDLIGEQEMNNVLRAYIAKTAFQQPPYTTSVEFETMLKATTPDSLKYAIVDGFEKITLYENRTKDVSFVKLPSGKYKVFIIIDAMKLYTDGKGKTTLTNMNDYIDIGIFGKGTTDKAPIELYNKKHRVKSGLNTFEIIVDKEPVEAGVDPYFKLIDRNTVDNIRKVSDKTPLKKIFKEY